MTRTAVAIISLILPVAVTAQKIPDPDKVAPQFHDAAAARRAELIRTKACTDKATREKVLKRDLATYINNCLDSAAKAEQAEVKAK